MTELRKRMIEDMRLAGLSQGTQEAYVRSVRQLAGHFRLPPDRITERRLRDYLIHLRDVRGWLETCERLHRRQGQAMTRLLHRFRRRHPIALLS